MTQPTDVQGSLDPDDPRHGTHAGYKAHQTIGEDACEPCRHAMSTYNATIVHEARNGRPRSVDPTGFRRRVQALQAIGWSLNVIADELGTQPHVLISAMKTYRYIRRARHEAMRSVYDRLSMTVPDDRFANRRRALAAKKGYMPPLAWDDIDTDPEPPAEPERGPGRPSDSLAEYEFLIRCGESHEQALTRLGVTASAIEMARYRAGKVA